MPKIGDKAMPYEEQASFPNQNPAVQEANKMGQELTSIPLESVEPEFPTSDASMRVENYQLGGAVQPPTAPSITPTPQYEKGGKV